MNRLSIVIASLLLTLSSGQDLNASPRKHNIVSNYVNGMLDSLFADLAKNLTIPSIDLGKNVGRIANLKGCFTELQKHVDGYKGFGFTLDTNATEILFTGSYDILNLDVPGLFPVYGKGNFRISVKTINLNLWLTAMYNSSEEKFDFSVSKFDILVEKSTVKFDNLMNDPYITDFLNELISNLVPDLATMITQPVMEFLQSFFDFYGNGIFDCIKKELTTEKIEECIKKLFQTDVAGSFPLTKEVEKFLPKLSAPKV